MMMRVYIFHEVKVIIMMMRVYIFHEVKVIIMMMRVFIFNTNLKTNIYRLQNIFP